MVAFVLGEIGRRTDHSANEPILVEERSPAHSVLELRIRSQHWKRQHSAISPPWVDFEDHSSSKCHLLLIAHPQASVGVYPFDATSPGVISEASNRSTNRGGVLG